MRRRKPGISNCFVLSGTRTNPAKPFRSPDRWPHRFALNARSTRSPRLRVRAWRGPCWWVRWFADLWRVHRWPRSQMGLYWKSMSTVAPLRVCIGPHGNRCTAELNSSRLLVRTCVIPLHSRRMCECELTSPPRMQSLTSGSASGSAALPHDSPRANADMPCLAAAPSHGVKARWAKISFFFDNKYCYQPIRGLADVIKLFSGSMEVADAMPPRPAGAPVHESRSCHNERNWASEECVAEQGQYAVPLWQFLYHF